MHSIVQHFTLSQLFLTSAEPGLSLAVTVLPYFHNPHTVRQSPSCLYTMLLYHLYKNAIVKSCNMNLNQDRRYSKLLITWCIMYGLCVHYVFSVH